MPHHLSAKKRFRLSAKAAARNRHYRSMMKSALKKVHGTNDRKEAEDHFRAASAMLDKLAGRGILHKNKAANQKSKLARRVNSLA